MWWRVAEKQHNDHTWSYILVFEVLQAGCGALALEDGHPKEEGCVDEDREDGLHNNLYQLQSSCQTGFATQLSSQSSLHLPSSSPRSTPSSPPSCHDVIMMAHLVEENFLCCALQRCPRDACKINLISLSVMIIYWSYFSRGAHRRSALERHGRDQSPTSSSSEGCRSFLTLSRDLCVPIKHCTNIRYHSDRQ